LPDEGAFGVCAEATGVLRRGAGGAAAATERALEVPDDGIGIPGCATARAMACGCAIGSAADRRAVEAVFKPDNPPAEPPKPVAAVESGSPPVSCDNCLDSG
jgi:hypothetical protein